ISLGVARRPVAALAPCTGRRCTVSARLAEYFGVGIGKTDHLLEQGFAGNADYRRYIAAVFGKGEAASRVTPVATALAQQFADGRGVLAGALQLLQGLVELVDAALQLVLQV